MVQNLAANASHPAFSGSVLPWRLDAGPLRFQSRRLQKREDIGIEFRIAIRAGTRKGLSQLLQHPLRSRVLRHVEMQDPAAAMFDEEETVEQLECYRRHGEEIQSNDRLAMVLQKREPTFSRITTRMDSPQIPSDGPLRDGVAEFLELA